MSLTGKLKGRGRSIKGRFILVVLLASVPFFLTVTSSTLLISGTSVNHLQQQIETTTNTLHDLIDSLLNSSVRTYLISKVETGRDLTEDALARMEAQPDKSEQIREELIRDLLSLQVGELGYFYAVDSSGKVVFHPDENIVGTDQHLKEPVDRQIEMREGYMEYQWRNTDEPQPRKKALYMSYIPELDWILTATSYRDEFIHMIDMESLRETVNNVSFSNDGYAYVVDRQANFIAHPHLTESEAAELMPRGEFEELVSRFFDHNDGFTTYQWRETVGGEKRTKMVHLKYLPDFDWIVGTAFYMDEVYRPITWMVVLNVVVAFAIAAVIVLIIYRINSSVTRQIDHLTYVFDEVQNGNMQERAEPSGPRELWQLGENFNRFLDRLEERTDQLSASLEEKEVLLREIQHRVKNNLQTIISLLNLQQQNAVSAETVSTLGKTNNSINAMAMVYDYLSHNPDDKTEAMVNMNTFFTNFIDSVLLSIRVDLSTVQVEKLLDEVYLDRNTAISCGLILNELLADSVARTVDRGIPGDFRVSLKENGNGRLLFSVADNREKELLLKGEPRRRTPEESSLVSVLTRQINGESEIVEDGYHEYRIFFDNLGEGH